MSNEYLRMFTSAQKMLVGLGMGADDAHDFLVDLRLATLESRFASRVAFIGTVRIANVRAFDDGAIEVIPDPGD